MIADGTIGPTPERLAKAGEDVEVFKANENEHWQAIRLLDGHVLESLQSRGAITGDQFIAGLQFYSDWYFAGLTNSGVIDPGRVIVDGGKTDPMGERKLTALNQWQQAVRALGLLHSQVLTDVLLGEETLASYGRRRHGYRNHKLAKVAATASLKDALTALDYHYHGKRRTRTTASHADDYRPDIPPKVEGT